MSTVIGVLLKQGVPLTLAWFVMVVVGVGALRLAQGRIPEAQVIRGVAVAAALCVAAAAGLRVLVRNLRARRAATNELESLEAWAPGADDDT